MEETLEKMDKLEKMIKEFTSKRYNIEEKMLDADEVVENIERIEEDSETSGYLYVSDNGISIKGSTPTVMCLLSSLISKLKECGLDEDLIKKSVEIGVADLEEQEKMLKERIKKMMEIMED